MFPMAQTATQESTPTQQKLTSALCVRCGETLFNGEKIYWVESNGFITFPHQPEARLPKN